MPRYISELYGQLPSVGLSCPNEEKRKKKVKTVINEEYDKVYLNDEQNIYNIINKVCENFKAVVGFQCLVAFTLLLIRETISYFRQP